CSCIAVPLDFFFQAEDGIRGFHVTGVQTCALPICDQRQPEVQVYYQILEPARTGPDIDDVDALVGREALQGLETLAVEPGADLPALAARLKVEMNRRLDRLGLLVIRCQLHVPTL